MKRPKPTVDRMRFREENILLEDGRPFGEVMEPWQREDFKALDSGRFRHGYLERPRGHSKTGDLATEAVVELILGKPGAQLFCVAADEQQARLLFDDVTGKLTRSPTLRSLVRITNKDVTVIGTGSRLKVLNSDAPSSWGLRPDWIAVDELAEWTKRALWDSLWSATGKRPTCRVVCISTVGWDRSSIGWEVRSMAEAEADWLLSTRGQCASWIRPEWLAQQQRTLPAHVFSRLHQCRWVDNVGAWLSSEQVEQIFSTVPGGDGPRCIGLDIGISRDRTAVAVVKQLGELVVVEHLLLFTPRKRQRVDLTEVEETVAALATRYHCPLFLDPYQAVGLGQRVKDRGVAVTEYPFTSDGRRKLFGGLLDLVTGNRLRAAPDEVFRRELLSLEVKETSVGWRVDHRASGHDDTVIAVGLGIAGLPASRLADLPILIGGARAVAKETAERRAGVPAYVSSEQRSIDAHAALETGLGGGRRSGLIL